MLEQKHAPSVFDFDGLRLKLASPDVIKKWSFGEVTRPETINYRTQKPEKDGLFSENIFGPSKDWECYCGKYKKIKYKGIVCDKCGVEVTRSIVRRERMGHIDLAAPVTHIWFLKGVPSKVGTLLDVSVQALEKVVYFASFIITNVNEDGKKETLEQLKKEYKGRKKQLEAEYQRKIEQAREKGKDDEDAAVAMVSKMEKEMQDKLDELDVLFKASENEIKELKVLNIISEFQYQELSLKYGHLFTAGIGAEAVRGILETLNLEKIVHDLEREIKTAVETKKMKLIRRLKLAKSFLKNNIRPEWMILATIPVIPPDLRPVVPLDGGRFATSDLNDLYRRVINRNNRLKHLNELHAPEVIVRNEKRMLQEAVDALIDNSARHGKTVMASTGQKRMLKSLADLLKGKQGRFRANLLGKRVDYSGRSVIVVGPSLRIDQCGLPKRMAVELFKPFIISQLIKREYVHNVRSASRFIESNRREVWDLLEEIIKDSYVLLNRAPTLHRLGIQAFKPVLIEGKAIQVHPLVCTAFNADFDGDQMAVHVPLTKEARAEAGELMLSAKNLLKPAHGQPVVSPNQDIVWGVFYLTSFEDENAPEEKLKVFSDEKQAIMAYNLKQVRIREKIRCRVSKAVLGEPEKKMIVTSVGRIIFNHVMPEGLEFRNLVIDKSKLSDIIHLSFEKEGQEKTAVLLDTIKDLGFKYLTQSGNSLGMDDFPNMNNKKELLADAAASVEQITNHYNMGLLSDEERHLKTITAWKEAGDKVAAQSKDLLKAQRGSVFQMIESKARGSWAQLNQIIGMKGLVTNPAGDIIDLPVLGNFKEGLDVLEYFISTHGARKGLSDTALRTANAGYLTRRLVDVSQDVFVITQDCGDTQGMTFTKKEMGIIGKDESLLQKFVGRYILQELKDAKGNVVLQPGELFTEELMRKMGKTDVDSVTVRSAMACKCKKGVCVKCYGYDLGNNKLAKLGLAAGVVAAQSIGEPGTQLTMRTFHTGGVAGSDITQGLPRVEELFEVRPPKKAAYMSDVDGTVSLTETEKTIVTDQAEGTTETVKKAIRISYQAKEEEEHPIPTHKKVRVDIKVKNGQVVGKGEILFIATVPKTKTEDEEIIETAMQEGVVRIDEDSQIIFVGYETKKVKEFLIPPGYNIIVTEGQEVKSGDALTEGSLPLDTLYRYKGREAVQKYIMSEIQYIYASQGQLLNMKHLEIIVRQLFSRVYVKDSGDSELLPGEIIERAEYLEALEALQKKSNAKLPDVEEVLLGISRVALSTKSFLSAASFIETQRVLTNAALSGKVDQLEGLKENVIIGRLIPVGTGFRGEQKNP